MLLVRGVVFLLSGLLLCFRTTSKAVRAIRWARERYTFTPAARTRCIASTARTSRDGIGHAISSGCIRLTNEDVIDLYSRVKVGALVVVLGPKQGLLSCRIGR